MSGDYAAMWFFGWVGGIGTMIALLGIMEWVGVV